MYDSTGFTSLPIDDKVESFWENLSAVCRPTNGWQTANKRLTVGQQSADSRPTYGRQSADRFFGELFFTITKKISKNKHTVFNTHKDYNTIMSKVMELMERQCVGKTNIIYERYCFNNRKQESGKSFDMYLTALRTLAKTCNFGSLKDELNRLWNLWHWNWLSRSVSMCADQPKQLQWK